MGKAENTILDLEAMANESLDSIQEAPDYSNPPPGEYVLDVKDAAIDKYTSKDEPGVQKQRIKITYAVAETVQLAGTEPPVPDGTLFTETFMATEQGLSFFKKRIRELMNAESVDGVSLSDMMNSVKGQQVKARLSIKLSPKPANKGGGNYENLQIRILQPQAA